MPPKYDVFISHAGEDKAKLAVLVYEGLKRRGISAFLDERELEVAGDAVEDMNHAMQTALVGLFLLSPEFAMKSYPMLEVECFLTRAGLLVGGGEGGSAVRPKLIPVFYRLTVAECKYASAFSGVECNPDVLDRFRERVERGETSLEKVLEHLTLLTKYTGVENKNGAGNGDTEEMAERRKKLAETICDKVNNVVVSRLRDVNILGRRDESRGESSNRSGDELHATFIVPKNPDEVVLNFSSAFEDGEPQTREAEVLREALRGDGGTRIVSIVGDGGVGKSCILREAGRHEEVKNRFPGGVYYLPLGMDCSVDTLCSELLRILLISGGKQAEERLRDGKSLQSVLEELGKLVGRERSLMLLDDVWERNGVTGRTVEQVAEMLSEKCGGVVMLTTRFASIAQRGHVAVRIDTLEAVSETSRRILLRYSKFSEGEVEREGMGWVIEELLILGGGLPVCLAVIGRGVGKLAIQLRGRRAHAWKAYWNKIRYRREPLFWDDVDDYKGLGKTLSTALIVLAENEDIQMHDGVVYTWAEMYRSLCVTTKQGVVPMWLLERLWKTSVEGMVRTIVEGFGSVGLGEVICGEEERNDGLKIHDLLHDFAVSFAKDEGEICVWHKRLLDAYRCSRVDGEGGVREWWKAHDDGYIHENVCRHLKDSGCTEELVELLLTVEWTLLRLEVGGLLGWKRDFAECLEGVRSSRRYANEKEDLRKGLCAVREAVVESWTYVTRNRNDLGYQVFGRLSDNKDGVVRRYLKSVLSWHPRPWLRPVSGFLWQTGEVRLVGEFHLGGFVQDMVMHEDPLFAVLGIGVGVVVVDFEGMFVKKVCTGHSDNVRKVWVSGDGAHALSWSRDGTIRKWDIRTGEELQVVTLERDLYKDCCWSCGTFSADGKVLVTGSRRGRVVMWETGSGERMGDAMCVADGVVACVAMSSNGSRIVVGGRDGSLRVWNVSEGAQERPIMTGHNSAVRCVAFSEDGRRIASGSEDETVRLWDAETKEQIGEPFCRHASSVCSVMYSEDGQQIASSTARDQTLYIWDSESNELDYELRFPVIAMNCIAMSATMRYVAASGGLGTLRVWDMEAASIVPKDPHRHDKPVLCMTGSADGRCFVSGSSDKTVRIWNSRTGAQLGETLRGHEDVVSCVAVCPDSRRVISGSWDNTVIEWDISSCSQVGEAIRGHTDLVECVAYSPNGQFFVSGSQDRTLRIWRANNHTLLSAPLHYAFVEPSRRDVTLLLPWRVRELMKCLVACTSGRVINTPSRTTEDGGYNRDERVVESNPTADERQSDDERHVDSNTTEDDRYSDDERDVDSSTTEDDRHSDDERAVDRNSEMSRRGESRAGHYSFAWSIVVTRDGQNIVCGLHNGEIWVWDIHSRKPVGSPVKTDAFRGARLEISGGNLVTAMDVLGTKLTRPWRLDERRGLVQIMEHEDREERSRESRERNERMKLVARAICAGDVVEANCAQCGNDDTLAQLPHVVAQRAWHFDSFTGALGVGMRDGRVLVFQIETEETRAALHTWL